MADSLPSVREPLQWEHWELPYSVIQKWVNPHFQIIKDSAIEIAQAISETLLKASEPILNAEEIDRRGQDS